jgi:hypothetical protein
VTVSEHNYQQELITNKSNINEPKLSTMKTKGFLHWFFLIVFIAANNSIRAQVDTVNNGRQYKNVIRYNLSGALLFGFDKYIVFGYERVVNPRQSFSINFGGAALPKLVSINTDSFNLQKDKKNSGYNFSADYRFYLAKENKYNAPHGLYIGPYYSLNHFTRESQWDFKSGSGANYLDSHTKFNINTFGFELGYQFILWKRFALDLVMVGPGFAFYDYKVTFDGSVNPADKQQLLDGLKQLLTQKFPGMNFVFANKEISSDGVMKANTIGYRYIFHIGYVF